ncbi:uncharacterized protein LOC129777243 isoform X2 [Toxorhynchites rutilus septentrionalis]|uniref:uncharacterized protein LOC129777243 isoform X2 n=1 Tax=Toxorhynchites rutilus septentrionalis TaxID=329112 RepID=UPI00247986AF|nr:uncharacterized protein LOC129777243 isoform X2 [Toxorhynchites rutilus septentrionalis]
MHFRNMTKQRRITLTLLLLSICVTLANGQIPSFGKCHKVPAVQNFNVDAFMGRWYEQEKYPYAFEYSEHCVTIDYKRNSEGIISITNRQTDFNGQQNLFYGTARIIKSGRLVARFPVPFNSEAPYSIVGTDYRTFAVVYSCLNFGDLSSRSMAWILTRQRSPSPKARRKAYAVLDAAKISRAYLTQTNQQNCDPEKRNINNRSKQSSTSSSISPLSYDVYTTTPSPFKYSSLTSRSPSHSLSKLSPLSFNTFNFSSLLSDFASYTKPSSSTTVRPYLSSFAPLYSFSSSLFSSTTSPFALDHFTNRFKSSFSTSTTTPSPINPTLSSLAKYSSLNPLFSFSFPTSTPSILSPYIYRFNYSSPSLITTTTASPIHSYAAYLPHPLKSSPSSLTSSSSSLTSNLLTSSSPTSTSSLLAGPSDSSSLRKPTHTGSSGSSLANSRRRLSLLDVILFSSLV